ncbi:MAG: hypothetical protein II305_04365 [Clostridia bacterium]|nr:hypothetical protein [Clostridia bacterium]
MFEFFDAIMQVLAFVLELLLVVPKAIAYLGGFTTYITAFAFNISEPFSLFIGSLVTISLTFGLLIGILK